MWHPEESNPLIAVVVRVHQEDHIRFPDLLIEVRSLVWKSRSIDYGGRNVLRRSNAWRNGNLWEHWLDLGGDEDILDKRSDQAGFASAFVAAYTYTNYTSGQFRRHRSVTRAYLRP